MKLQQPALLMAGALLLASCAPKVPHYPGPSAFESGHWRMVASSPPTYFPRGMSGSHPTNVRDGFWIFAGDPTDSRFFVPTKGCGRFTRTQLESEAKAAIDPDLLRQMARRNRWSNFFYPASSSSSGSTSFDDHDCSDDDGDDRNERRTCPPRGSCPPQPGCPPSNDCPPSGDCPPGVDCPPGDGPVTE